MLWFSNGGRFYAPERQAPACARRRGWLYLVALRPCRIITHNPMNEIGIPTSISLDPQGRVDVRHVIGTVPTPSGWGRPAT